MSPQLTIELEREVFEPGDSVRGHVHVVEGGASRALHAALRFVEESNGWRHAAHEVQHGPIHRGDLPAGADVPFLFALPADAPPELSGPHGELYWDVYVRSDQLGPDTHVSRRISVRPRD